MQTVFIIIGTLVALCVAFVVWRYLATVSASRRRDREIMGEITAVLNTIQEGGEPTKEAILSLVQRPETRNHTYGMLVYLRRSDLFPEEYRKAELIAESDLVYWLCHPNELGCPPSEIEMMHKQYIETGVKPPKALYFVFRFRTRGPHWAAKDGWMAGVAGPYKERNGETSDGAPGTFSTFEPYASKAPEEHVDFVHQLMLRRGGYEQLRGA